MGYGSLYSAMAVRPDRVLFRPNSKFITVQISEMETPATGEIKDAFAYGSALSIDLSHSGFQVLLIEDNKDSAIQGRAEPKYPIGVKSGLACVP